MNHIFLLLIASLGERFKMMSTVTCTTCGKEARWGVNDDGNSYYELNHKTRTGFCSMCFQCRPVLEHYFYFCSLDCLKAFVDNVKSCEKEKE